MARSDSMYMRIDPQLKIEAEAILSRLGLTPNDAINVFLNQVVLQRGLPFEIKIPSMKRGEAEAMFFGKIKEAEESFETEPCMSIDELEAKLGV